ncbi:MAG: divergent polysaccharide deacetylase family protein [Pseudomonadota bacterium]|nr:divergent polysaccharide deacetylase family protein [Pseudomonadota bacterium]MDE3038428.1 divergent polysaccharide deacetylase family protein [Pseudomonadota bacterium]
MALKDKIKLLRIKLRFPRLAMPGLPDVRQPPSAGLLWRAGLAALLVLALILLAVLWTSGARDTRQAMSDGRRLIIQLDTGEIEGKQITLNKPPPVLAKTSAVNPAGASVPLSALAAMPPAAPKDALMEKSADGPLPIIGQDGTKPWRYYAKPFDRTGSRPAIAIIVTGLGENIAATEEAIKLPENVTVSFSPYSRDIAGWRMAARTAGHEMMLDLPLQPGNYPVTDPGPYSLLVGNKNEVNEKHLDWLMSRFAGYTGFVTPPNDAFSADSDSFKVLLQLLAGRGLMLVMGDEPAEADTRQIINTANAAIVTADLLIDEDLSPIAIQARLTSLEQIARDRGYAIGIAQAYPLTMQQLAAWAARLNADGVTLVPVSFIVKLRFS